MYQSSIVNKTSFILDGRDKIFIGILDMLSSEGCSDRMAETAIHIDRIWKQASLFNNTVGNANSIVILTVRRSLMNHSSSTVVGNIRIAANFKCCRMHQISEKRKDWLVSEVFQLFSSDFLQNFPSFSEASNFTTLRLLQSPWKRSDTNLSDHKHFLRGILDIDIRKRGVHTQGEVGREGPRRGRPRHE